jgi:hypothetical protein
VVRLQRAAPARGTNREDRVIVRPRAQLQLIVASGLSRDPLEHAEQFAQVASILHDAFGKAGLRSTVVGGSAIEIHAPGVYMSGDIDLVVERLRYDAAQIESVFESLGFERAGRHWRMGDLFVEVPSTTLSDPSELMRVGNAAFEIIKKEVVLADRIIGYRQWGTLAYGQQAIDLLAAFGPDIDEVWLREKLLREASLDALAPLRDLAATDEAVDKEVLEHLLSRLQQGRQRLPRD